MTSTPLLPPESPATQAAPPAERASAAAASAALEALLEPGLRLALHAGLSYADVDDVVRRLLVQLAPELLRDTNTSQIAVITGLNRKEVQRLVLQRAQTNKLAPQNAADAQSPRKRSVASQLFLHWVAQLQSHPQWESLPLTATDGMSFTQLARSAISDVHPRAVLDELLRLGLAAEEGGMVRLLARNFVPSKASDERLGIMMENVADHLRGGLQNVRGDAPPQLEQALWGDGLSLASCRELDAAARAEWSKAHDVLYAKLLATPEAEPGEARFRFKVGMYAHAAEQQAAAPKPAAQANKKRRRR
jgi:hypothetical protein